MGTHSRPSVYLISGSRTAQGSLMGALSDISAPELGKVALQGAIKKAKIDPQKIEQIYMGNVLQAGVGQAPARQVAIKAGLSEATSAVTINKVCGSGMMSVILAAQQIQLGQARLVAAGGMESMSQAPHFIPQGRAGLKFGTMNLMDSMLHDGLWDVYSQQTMGSCAEICLQELKISREEQDEFAMESFRRAQAAQASGFFAQEIEAVVKKTKKGEILIQDDEGPGKADFAKIPQLRPVFDAKGSITAANASTINDGASCILLGDDSYQSQGEFRLVSYATHAQNPTWFTTAPVEAMKKSLTMAGLKWGDIDQFEINEAFAMVTLAAIKELKLDAKKVNPYGGAISLGHPIGSSGSRILVTLMNGMRNKSLRYGMASLCIGGGEGLSVIIERVG